MPYKCRVVADSVSPAGKRVTTLEVTYPRFVHSELLTHRMLCLAGDAELEFDLPSGGSRSEHRVHRMRLDEFVDKWVNGARRMVSPRFKRDNLTWLEDGKTYSAVEVASYLGMASATNVNAACRSGELNGLKNVTGSWVGITTKSIRAWRERPSTSRFDMRERLRSMRIRQLNEVTGDIQWSRVTDACVSGEKEVFEVRAGDFSVAGSANHRIMTADGWKTIGDLKPGVDKVVCRKFGKHEEDRADPLRLRRIDGVWRSNWQRQQRARLQGESLDCRRCGLTPGTCIHHVVPVYQDPSLALIESNITFLCESCHEAMHEQQDWQGGTCLYGAAVLVDEVVSRGVEQTYDLSIAGDHPNFLANGVVVHNSRNSSSSRAIPVEKMMAQVKDDPALPVYWGSNKPGMQAGEELVGDDLAAAKRMWLFARDRALDMAGELSKLHLHKQLVNRVLEPWMFITVLVTATEWGNFFKLRCHPAAQPEIRQAAEMMQACMEKSEPSLLHGGEWHMPFWRADDVELGLTEHEQLQVSVARCARVSYLTHDGQREPAKDVILAASLAANGHWSPFEHVCMASEHPAHRSGNFLGWKQYREVVDFGFLAVAPPGGSLLRSVGDEEDTVA